MTLAIHILKAKCFVMLKYKDEYITSKKLQESKIMEYCLRAVI